MRDSKPPDKTASETLEPQQVSCLSHAKPWPAKLSKRRHTRTPAKMLEKCFAQRKAEPQQVLSLSHCETAARKIAETLPLEPTKKKQKDGKPASNQAKPKKKVFGERMRKSRTPAGFVPRPCKTVARKTLETSPTKRTILKDSKTSKTSPTERQNPRKRSLGSAYEKAEPQQVSCLNHAKP